jgi:NAD(P)-dependent dehydrogenase (short-subunit alcohol dehydrogenase family)
VTICAGSADALEAARQEAKQLGVELRVVVAGVSQEHQLAAVEAAAVDGSPDLAVANAGSAQVGSLLHFTPDMWAAALGLNIVGTAQTSRCAAGLMKKVRRRVDHHHVIDRELPAPGSSKRTRFPRPRSTC